jgi:hypothetical protein
MYVLTENKLLKTGKDGEIIQKTETGDTVPYADLNAGWVLNWKNESQKKYSLESETVGEKPKANACGFIPIITPLKAKNDDAQKTGDTVPYTDAVRASVHAAAGAAGAAIETSATYNEFLNNLKKAICEKMDIKEKPECDFDCKSLGMPEKKCDNCSYKPPF